MAVIKQLLRLIIALFGRFGISPTLAAYSLVSAAALCLDVALLFLLRQYFALAAVAGTVSYLMGNFFHYLVSLRFVFPNRRRKSLRAMPAVEYLACLLCAFAGVSLTAAILYIGADRLALPLLPVKGAAIVASFFTVYFLKTRLVFPQPKPHPKQ